MRPTSVRDFCPPLPADKRFRAKVRALVQDADDGARDLAGLPRKVLVKRRGRYKTRARSAPGTCVNCGCRLDEATEGCVNCVARHDARHRAQLSLAGRRY